jgi:hypothetical protein
MGYRMNKELASGKDFRDELVRVRHLSDAAERMDAAAGQIPLGERLKDRVKPETLEQGATNSAMIGLELAIAELQQNAEQLLTAIQKMGVTNVEAMSESRPRVWPRL